MLGQDLTARLPSPTRRRSQDLGLISSLKSTIARLIGVLLISLAMALGISARLLEPFSGSVWLMAFALRLSSDHSHENLTRAVKAKADLSVTGGCSE